MSTSRSSVESRKAPKVDVVPLWRATAPSTRSKKPAPDHEPAAGPEVAREERATAAPTETSAPEDARAGSGSAAARRGRGRGAGPPVEPVAELLFDHDFTAWEQPLPANAGQASGRLAFVARRLCRRAGRPPSPSRPGARPARAASSSGCDPAAARREAAVELKCRGAHR